MQQLLLEDKKSAKLATYCRVVVFGCRDCAKLGNEASLSSPKFIFTVTAILPAEHELLDCWHLHTVHVNLHDIRIVRLN